ncbi:MAG: nicotinate (nicotinamide) nucleotide adenylyltransferase [Salegentibacter sp.]|uniref:Probable nicotinate-nucleotide adenylyltransferase n=1 Tax=Salegentibacter flavus TaxID=287099 RepID=A0A1I5AWI5_9FLAO|nr:MULTISPECIES: nicotinate (nicotinamide) nucleotide adenylyltransferase [Salegentibacter]MDR9455884.1 nicotinate (nicotinamide) nucleotide adenylyltransferase [Salegentibacter sp.]SFN66815.1 nicotinate-nucleotide adenylyltransferase [Salegentibacter flavus]
MNKKVGLFFGTFNPVHIGHLIIANHMAEFSDLDEVWLVVTPHNPFKKKSSLLENHHRLEMVYKACEGYENLKPSDIEFALPQPNYTVTTLAHLQEKYPTNVFCPIMGKDNLKSFHKWKNYEVILENHQIYIYPRIATGNSEDKFLDHPKITRVAAPVMEISSTFIRRAVKEGKNIKPMLPAAVWDYIKLMNFYR